MTSHLPVVAVVGRPNVGKSTLVNRIVGRREAIVEERPGVTRDRKALEAEWAGRDFLVVDTGGWVPTGSGDLAAQVSRQAERAVAEADVVLLVVDVTVGVTEEDDRVAGVLRRALRERKRPPAVLVVANKVDGDSRENDAWDFGRLGLGDPIPVSAMHGRGSGDLLDAVVANLPPPAEGNEDESSADGDGEVDAVVAVAIVGRPNVGKSTLFNRLIGDERSVVHDAPGTTRDAIDTVVDTPEGPIRFVDTAGMRRKSRIDEGAEYYSLVRALQAIDRSDAALLVLDATEGVTAQDQRLAERVDAAGSPIVVVLNKWDLLDAEQRAALTAAVGDRLGFLGYAPVLKVSALTGKGIHKVLPALHQAVDAYHRRVPTRELNEVVQAAQAAHAAPGARVLYCTQAATDPPTFTLFANRPLPPTYLRYLERRIREHFEFGPTPLKLRVRRRS
ncbi:MAG TPA: ribosome biogenesis GTPase Der [Acidimicrobiales bacterium]|nr:ribosome biogenesis GTPase Der [Acidimicrobiales bacterium]